MSTVLVVDDEPLLLRAMELNLTHRGYDVLTAGRGSDAIAMVLTAPPDLIVLDLGLPDMDGLEVVRVVRDRIPALPVVVLSARADSRDKVAALDLGAIDYVTKPFDMPELIARIRAALRRVGLAPSDPVVQLGDVTVDLAARLARRGGSDEPLHFTPTEWRILDALLRNPGRLIPSRELLTAVRGDPDHTDSSYLRIYLAQLRRKLEPVPSRPRYLLTEPGMGYRFQP
jgi:two-component system KDP operon response regulator KdpE